MDRRKLWLRVGFSVAALVLVVGIVLLMRGGAPEEALEVKAPDDSPNTTEPDEEGFIMVGGVRRRATDIRPAQPREIDENALAAADKKHAYGSLPKVEPDANPYVESVTESLRDGTHSERVSVLAPPKQFDAKASKANPKAYLEVVEPGRVFQAAQPGPDVPRLGVIDDRRQQITQGDTATLRVVVPPGAPVTFTAFDGGAFDNELTSITVQAGKDGLAQAKFTGTPGTIADVKILAASPLASGQARFVVHVVMAE